VREPSTRTSHVGAFLSFAIGDRQREQITPATRQGDARCPSDVCRAILEPAADPRCFGPF
jgi:hypothetical protein